MTSESNTETRHARPSLEITRSFEAPRDLAYAAWAQPEHIVRWWRPLSYDLDGRVGGTRRRDLRSAAGAVEGRRAIRRDLVPPEPIVMSAARDDHEGDSPHEMLITITFVEGGERKTSMTLHEAPFRSIEERDEHLEGATILPETLGTYLASPESRS